MYLFDPLFYFGTPSDLETISSRKIKHKQRADLGADITKYLLYILREWLRDRPAIDEQLHSDPRDDHHHDDDDIHIAATAAATT